MRQLAFVLLFSAALFAAACNPNPAPTPPGGGPGVVATPGNSVIPPNLVPSPLPTEPTPLPGATVELLPITPIVTNTIDPALLATYTAIAIEVSTMTGGQPTTDPLAQMPLPGTLIPGTPDPQAQLVFDQITYVQSGGITGTTLTVTVRQDGSVTRDGVPSARGLTPDAVTQIDDFLDQINFFGLSGIFISRAAQPDATRYDITVERAGSTRTLQLEDGLFPDSLRPLLVYLSQAGLTPPGQ